MRNVSSQDGSPCCKRSAEPHSFQINLVSPISLFVTAAFSPRPTRRSQRFALIGQILHGGLRSQTIYTNSPRGLNLVTLSAALAPSADDIAAALARVSAKRFRSTTAACVS